MVVVTSIKISVEMGLVTISDPVLLFYRACLYLCNDDNSSMRMHTTVRLGGGGIIVCIT